MGKYGEASVIAGVGFTVGTGLFGFSAIEGLEKTSDDELGFAGRGTIAYEGVVLGVAISGEYDPATGKFSTPTFGVGRRHRSWSGYLRFRRI